MGAAAPPVEHGAPPVDAGGGHQEGESKHPSHLPHPLSCSRPTLRTPVHEPTAHGLPWLVSCGGASVGSSNATPRCCQWPRPIQPILTDSGFLLGISGDFLGASEALLAPLLRIPMLDHANPSH